MKVIIYKDVDEYTPIKRPDRAKLCGDGQMWKRGTDLLPRVNFYSNSKDIELLQCPQLVQLYNAYQQADQLILDIEVGAPKIAQSQPWSPGAKQPVGEVIEPCGDRKNTLYMSDEEKDILVKYLRMIPLDQIPDTDRFVIQDMCFMLQKRSGEINKTRAPDDIIKRTIKDNSDFDDKHKAGILGALQSKYE